MNYFEQLETPQWKRKRALILLRDDLTCACCGKQFSGEKLNVHHRYYDMDKMAWEYNNDALITLCQDCHEKTHRNNTIPVYVLIDGEKNLADIHPCSRCDGTGYLPEYKHIQGGICFKCWGTGCPDLSKDNPRAIVAKKRIWRLSLQFLTSIKTVTVRRYKEIDRPKAIIRFKDGSRKAVFFDFNSSAEDGDQLSKSSLRWIEYECELPDENRTFLTGMVLDM